MQLLISVLMIVTTGWMHSREPVILADSLETYYGSTTFLTLDDGILLFVNSDEQIYRMDISDPASARPFDCDWDPEAIGWSHPTNTLLQAKSLCGSLICFTQQVHFPDSLQTYETSIPGPVAVVVSDTDGSNARIIALSFDIGSSPDFRFTSDSKYIFGGLILRCLPTPEHFAAYVVREDESQVLRGYLIDVETGARSGDGECVMNDGYGVNPWSDLATTGGYPPTMIVDVVTQEILIEDSNVGSSGIINRWVLPDAGLANKDGTQVLLYSDGTEVTNPGNDISIYAVLSDGRYMFSYDSDRELLLLGNIDWDTFESLDADTLQGLEEYNMRYCRILENMDDEWLILVDGWTLYSYELP